MIVKLLTEHLLKFLSLKESCTGPSESTFVKIPHCWKSRHGSYDENSGIFGMPLYDHLVKNTGRQLSQSLFN